MMVNKLLRRFFIIGEDSEEIKVVSLFRYISLILTSIFFFIGDHNTPIVRKVIVIIFMSIASYVLNYLYIVNYSTKDMIKFIIFMEIIGNTMVLVPTGGMSSPYFLYSLNTILIMVYYFNVFYGFLSMLLYIALSMTVSFLLLNKPYSGIENTIVSNSNMLLSYLLISVVSQQLLMLSKKLTAEISKTSSINAQLIEANTMANDSMEHIISLYDTVYSFKNINNKDKLIEILVEYTKRITNTSTSFYFMHSDNDERKMQFNGNLAEATKDKISTNLHKEWKDICKTEAPISMNMDYKEFLIMIIKSPEAVYGAIGIEIDNKINSILYNENINQVKFLSSLGVLTFQRLELESVNERLLIGEEQKRIADELHDITSQRLFGASCMINTLIYKSKDINAEQLVNDLKLVRDILGTSITDLRNTIYNLSRKTTGISVFQSELIKFTEDISKLNNIKVSLNMAGDEYLLNNSVQKSIFRIICEGTGNAVRHGKCNNLVINLTIEMDHVNLILKDDGIGFNVENKISKKNRGLGLKNMVNSVYLMNGKININSQPGEGTTVTILLPINAYFDKRKTIENLKLG